MKKKELRKEFEERLKNITVSDDLKEKTLANIYSKNNVYRLPYWIKNCAAIFVVTCLCLSIYIINNKNIFDKKTEDESSVKLHIEDYSLQSINDESLKMESSINSSEGKTLMKSATFDSSEFFPNDINANNLAPVQFSITRSTPAPILEDSYIVHDSESVLTEEEFLKNNPNAQQTENGYKIIKDNVEIFYELKDGFIYEINN